MAAIHSRVEGLLSILPLEEGDRVTIEYESTQENANPPPKENYLVVECEKTDGDTAKVWLNPTPCRRDDAEIRASASMVYSRFFERAGNMQRRKMGTFPRFTRVEAESA